MFCTFCAIISPEWIHSCQGSGDWKVVATSGHLSLAAHPPTYVGFGRTGRTNSLQPTALSRFFMRLFSLLGRFKFSVVSLRQPCGG